ncbi:hypothetical protein F0562_024535 [Nyssa sinensis]|uniref:3-beta hydroxysteroid dehydrogenase/isomerase domain-containing protein n=1 Tax=Nyssa sinensis TaxID=561372 RepID=A0A5J5BDC7_9ASTE|nr:hypothetical protein F0562_024535 [Nyssa sinensis]
MMAPAVNGTKNVIIAAAEAKVRRMVLTSSIGAVYMDPDRYPDKVVDDSCWSDLQFCKNTKIIGIAMGRRTVAEQAAWEVAKEKGVELVVVNPVMVLGPLLQPTVNGSIVHILKYLTGSAKTYANSVQSYVYVKDVALSHDFTLIVNKEGLDSYKRFDISSWVIQVIRFSARDNWHTYWSTRHLQHQDATYASNLSVCFTAAR